MVTPSEPRLCLASRSPRRRALLGALGLSFTVATPDVDESVGSQASPSTMVRELAELKARDFVTSKQMETYVDLAILKAQEKK